MTYIPPHLRPDTEKDQLLFGKKVNSVLNGTYKERAKPTHKESDLHLAFCKWLTKSYPELTFIRHEKEGKRTKFMQHASTIYNSRSGIPDFELIHHNGRHSRLYIEFKKPGETWVKLDGFVKPNYQHQYEFHLKLWEQNSCAYFCNDLEMAKELLSSYMMDASYPMQVYLTTH